ncbi:HD domain-containing protein [bacterium]|nr:HD domain-containing protein [bacterium]
MISMLSYVICALIWLVDTSIGDVPWWCWVNWSVALLCCLGRQLGQWRLSRRELAVMGAVEIFMIVAVLIVVGYKHSPLFIVGALALVEQGHRIGARWGLACGLLGAISVALGKWLILDPNFTDPQFSFVFYAELAFWPVAGVLQLRLYAPEGLRTNVSRAGGQALALSDMSETGIINLLNSTTNRLYALLDLFRQLETERDMNKLLHSAVAFAKENTRSDAAAFLMPEDGALTVVCSAGEGVVAANNDRGDLSVLENVMKSGEPFYYRSERVSEGMRVPWLDRLVRAYIAVPMADTLDNKPLGVLVVANSQNREDYEAGTVDFLTLMASEVGVAVSNDRLYTRLEQASADLSATLARVIDAKEDDSEGHVMRVVKSSVELARTQGLSRDEIEDISRAAMLHDVGKVYVPDDILHKQGPMSAKEFAILKEHTTRARELLQGLTLISDDVIDMIVHHHERYDGNGYPDKLKGDKICLGACIIAIADTFDGLTNDRAQRKGMTWEKALEVMAEGRGTQFHPQLLDEFLELKRSQLEKR